MAEQYEIAAERHLLTGEKLEEMGRLDDAGYHFGMSGENSVKSALTSAGLVAYWTAQARRTGINFNRYLKSKPIRGHYPNLHRLIQAAQMEISSTATGRLSANISAHMLNPTFAARFANWSINIRYADTNYTPVTAPTCTAWKNDAADLYLLLVL